MMGIRICLMGIRIRMRGGIRMRGIRIRMLRRLGIQILCMVFFLTSLFLLPMRLYTYCTDEISILDVTAIKTHSRLFIDV